MVYKMDNYNLYILSKKKKKKKIIINIFNIILIKLFIFDKIRL